MMDIDISIVIPAFNEAKRLPVFLGEIISYCDSRPETYEIIVVDDGSHDDTAESVIKLKAIFPSLNVIRIRKNRGKGYAVKRGLLRSNGKICLFMDADGSVGPEEISRNLHYLLENGYDIFVGSRVLKGKKQVLKIRWYRKIIGLVFNYCVQTILFKNIKDTQCGFKMFKREVITPLFSRSYIKGFTFDIEILYLAYKMGYKVKEGPVSWHHVDCSKINLALDPLRMFIDILRLRNWDCTPINVSAKYLGPDEYRYMYELENIHWWFISRRNLMMHLIDKLKLTSQPAILDVGAGTGGNISSLSSVGKTYGIDASEKAIAFCLKRGIRDISQATAEHIIYPDSKFDIITCIDVLEHLADPKVALLEMKRVLKESGKIIITVPAFRILWSQHDEALCHLRRYEKESLICDLYEAGLKVGKIGYFFFISFFIVAPIRIIRKFYLKSMSPHSDTTTLPPKILNKFLIFLFGFELRILDKVPMPIGTTLYAVVSK